jgi:aspartate/methionine/tyrosine aminotransferase
MQPSILQQKAAARALAVAAAPSLPAQAAEGSTSTAVREASADAVERHQCDHYTRRPGIAPLCRAIAARLSTQGVPTHENDVVISGSVQECRYVALRSLAVGRTVYMAVGPSEVYSAALQFAGAAPVLLAAGEELPAAGAAGQALLLIAHPSAADSERLAAWAAAQDLPVVADETLAPLVGHTPFAALEGMAQRTLTLGSFAGAPGLSAWQVSWFAGPKALLTPVRDLKQSITICTSAPSQYAALAALAEALVSSAGGDKESTGS